MDRPAFEKLLEDCRVKWDDETLTLSKLVREHRALWDQGLRVPTHDETLTLGSHAHTILPELHSNPTSLNISWTFSNEERRPARLPSILPDASGGDTAVEAVLLLGYWSNAFVSAADNLFPVRETDDHDSITYLVRILNSLAWVDTEQRTIVSCIQVLREHIALRLQSQNQPSGRTPSFDAVLSVTLAASRLFSYTTAWVRRCPVCKKIWTSPKQDGNSVVRRYKVDLPQGPGFAQIQSIPPSRCLERYFAPRSSPYDTVSACPDSSCDGLLDVLMAVMDRLPPFLIFGADWGSYWRSSITGPSPQSLLSSISLPHYDITKPAYTVKTAYRFVAIALRNADDEFFIGISNAERDLLYWFDISRALQCLCTPINSTHEDKDSRDAARRPNL
ncbi:MAG: hypothetical protein LQ337_002601 [Flavoplaca oasis]|nr:MAG: hypothetical protein LQ337_002601 [Flavoplaca oasis]